MQITVSEARLLKNAVSNKLRELMQERDRIAFVEFEKGEEYTVPDRKFDEVTKDIERVQKHYRIVKRALAENNLATTIEWKGETLTLVEALELVKQLRWEAENLKHYGIANQVERINRGAFDTKVSYKKALFDPPAVKREAERILKEANRLSILIDKAIFNATVDIDFADEYQ